MSTRSSKVFCPLRDMDMVPIEKLVFLKIFVNSIFFHKLVISEKFGFILFNLLITIITSIWDVNIYTIYSMKCWKVCIIVKNKIWICIHTRLTKKLKAWYFFFNSNTPYPYITCTFKEILTDSLNFVMD